jgi:hypothetical protein
MSWKKFWQSLTKNSQPSLTDQLNEAAGHLAKAMQLIKIQDVQIKGLEHVLHAQENLIKSYSSTLSEMNERFLLQEEMIMSSRDAWENLHELATLQASVIRREVDLDDLEALEKKANRFVKNSELARQEYIRLHKLYEQRKSTKHEVSDTSSPDTDSMRNPDDPES